MPAYSGVGASFWSSVSSPGSSLENAQEGDFQDAAAGSQSVKIDISTQPRSPFSSSSSEGPYKPVKMPSIHLDPQHINIQVKQTNLRSDHYSDTMPTLRTPHAKAVTETHASELNNSAAKRLKEAGAKQWNWKQYAVRALPLIGTGVGLACLTEESIITAYTPGMAKDTGSMAGNMQQMGAALASMNQGLGNVAQNTQTTNTQMDTLVNGQQQILEQLKQTNTWLQQIAQSKG